MEYLSQMDEMTCPSCGGRMTSRRYDEATAWQCGACKGVFLDRSDLNALVEAENTWHSRRTRETAPMPKITPEMTAPPAQRKRSRSFLDVLFSE